MEYTLKNMSSPMGVANYKIEDTLPEDLKKYLPTPEKIIESVEGIDEF